MQENLEEFRKDAEGKTLLHYEHFKGKMEDSFRPKRTLKNVLKINQAGKQLLNYLNEFCNDVRSKLFNLFKSMKSTLK